MEVYNNLHESLQTHVNKMQMTHNVIPELRSKKVKTLCLNCAHHGFPCLNCAYHVYNGKLGPGYSCGKRLMFSNEPSEDDEVSNFNMLLFICKHDLYNLEFVQ